MSNKKNMNNMAIDRVRGTNADAASYLKEEQYHSYSPVRHMQGAGNYSSQPQNNMEYDNEMNQNAPQFRSLE